MNMNALILLIHCYIDKNAKILSEAYQILIPLIDFKNYLNF